VDAAFGRIRGRGKWAIGWMEEDSPILGPQLWVGRFRKDAADALAYGCTGLMGLHWRTDMISPAVQALARAGWDQSGWNPQFGKPRPAPPTSTFRTGTGKPAGKTANIGNRRIAGTDDQPLYQTCRYDLDEYLLRVPNGRYRVTLKFCEPHFDAAGKRVFDVTLEGKTVRAALDIFAVVGKFSALDLAFDGIEVKDGRLDIGLRRRTSLPCIMAIVVSGGGLARKINCGGGDYKDYASDVPLHPSTPTFMHGPRGTSWKPRGLPVDDLYADWALAMFGPQVAKRAAAFFTRLDGRIPLTSTWTGGAGGLRPDNRPWEWVAREFAFVDDFQRLRTHVRGAGNLDRFDFWLNNFRHVRSQARVKCLWGRLNRCLEAAKAQGDPAKRKAMASKTALPLYRQLIAEVGRAYGYQLATVNSRGGLATVTNWEGHNWRRLIDEPGKRLAALGGKPLPADAAATKAYQGRPRIIVPTVRSLAARGEVLKLKVIVLANERAKEAALHWRPLGQGPFRKIALQHVARAVYRVTLPPAADDFEYYIRAAVSGGKPLTFPPTAPRLNQTVVVMPGG